MKSHVADQATIVHAVRIEARDGSVLRFVEYPRDLDMGGSLYRSDNGYAFTGVLSSSTAAASMVDMDGIFASQGVARADVEAGLWDGAMGYVFATSWQNPVEDEEPIGKFILGKLTLLDEKYRVELMQLIDALNQPVGRNISAVCPWTLFDETLDGYTVTRSKCRLSIDDYLEQATVTAVDSNLTFTASSLTQDAGWFSLGWVKWATGENAGLPMMQVLAFESGEITLFDPAPYAIAPGDEFDIVPGCNKLGDTCRIKFDNKINFGGFDRVVPGSVYSKIGGVDV